MTLRLTTDKAWITDGPDTGLLLEYHDGMLAVQIDYGFPILVDAQEVLRAVKALVTYGENEQRRER